MDRHAIVLDFFKFDSSRVMPGTCPGIHAVHPFRCLEHQSITPRFEPRTFRPRTFDGDLLC
jgi:hypothetical protein